MVHHIFPREDYPEFQWSEWNLISLSSEMHNALHDRNSGELTEKGMDLLKRTKRKMIAEGRCPWIFKDAPPL